VSDYGDPRAPLFQLFHPPVLDLIYRRRRRRRRSAAERNGRPRIMTVLGADIISSHTAGHASAHASCMQSVIGFC